MVVSRPSTFNPQLTRPAAAFEIKGVDKVGQVFPLHYATIFPPHDGIVSEFQGSGLDPSKPSLKARKVERILLAGVNDEHREPPAQKTGGTRRSTLRKTQV